MDDKMKDTQKRTVKLPENYDDLRALLLGVCQAIGDAMNTAADYNELIQDELESRGGNTAYLAKVLDEAKRLRLLLNEVQTHFAQAEEADRFNLSLMLHSLAERVMQKQADGGFGIDEFIDDNLYMRGNSYQLKNMFEGMMSILQTLNRSEESTEALSLAALRIQPPKTMGAIVEGLCGAGQSQEVIVVALCEKAALPKHDQAEWWRSLHPFHELVRQGISTQELFRNAEWMGATLANGGKLFYSTLDSKPNAVMLFPLCQAGDGEDALELYRCPDGDEPKTILVVDDEDMIWDVLMEMLLGLGYNVLLASDGKEAVEMYGANLGKIDLVILDMLMPNMGGEEAFYILKELDPNVRVLISSGYVSQEEIQNVMDEGAAGFLRKPYRMVDLARKIHEMLTK